MHENTKSVAGVVSHIILPIQLPGDCLEKQRKVAKGLGLRTHVGDQEVPSLWLCTDPVPALDSHLGRELVD